MPSQTDHHKENISIDLGAPITSFSRQESKTLSDKMVPFFFPRGQSQGNGVWGDAEWDFIGDPTEKMVQITCFLMLNKIGISVLLVGKIENNQFFPHEMTPVYQAGKYSAQNNTEVQTYFKRIAEEKIAVILPRIKKITERPGFWQSLKWGGVALVGVGLGASVVATMGLSLIVVGVGIGVGLICGGMTYKAMDKLGLNEKIEKIHWHALNTAPYNTQNNAASVFSEGKHNTQYAQDKEEKEAKLLSDPDSDLNNSSTSNDRDLDY